MDAETVVQNWVEIRNQGPHWRDSIGLLRAELLAAPSSFDTSRILVLLDQLEIGSAKPEDVSQELLDLLVKDDANEAAFVELVIAALKNGRSFET